MARWVRRPAATSAVSARRAKRARGTGGRGPPSRQGRRAARDWPRERLLPGWSAQRRDVRLSPRQVHVPGEASSKEAPTGFREQEEWAAFPPCSAWRKET